MAVTEFQSLYSACNKVALEGVSSIQSIGGYDTFIELYTQDDIDKNLNDIIEGNYDSNNNLITKCNLGDNKDESRIILITGNAVEIPENYTLTPLNCRKSLVILCDKFINNGVVSMTGKGPNILPHEYYIIGQTDGYDEDIIIPAYANNRATSTNGICNGNNGVNHQCGSGGSGATCNRFNSGTHYFRTGSGSAFAGGAGSGGIANTAASWRPTPVTEVDTTYPMRGARGYGYRCNNDCNAYGYGGVGNPSGTAYDSWGNVISTTQNFGVGGRIVIFCTKFENNGTISANGITPANNSDGYDNRERSSGGPSGGGAIDVFYNKLITEGTIVANGGSAVSATGKISATGKGGNGAITLTQYNASSFVLPGYANKDTLTKFVELVKTGLATKTGIDDTQQRANMTYSSKKIESMIPTSISDLTNDAGFLSRHITAKEVRTIWDDTEV